MKSIIVRLKGRKVEIEADGYAGSDCEEAIKRFQDALGGKVEASEKKPEYYQQQSQAQTQ